MGWMDRDYYREPEPRNWTQSPIKVTVGLMLVVGAVFIFQVLGSSSRIRPDQETIFLQAGFSWPQIQSGEVWRLLTWHITHQRDALVMVVFELILLFYFGRSVEKFLGSAEFGAVLIVTALTISGAKCLSSALKLDVLRETAGFGPLLASVLILYVYYFFYESHEFIIRMPSAVAVGIPILLMMLGEVRSDFQMSGRVAHISGMLLAVLYGVSGIQLTRYLTAKTPVRQRSRRAPKLRLHAGTEPTTDDEKPSQDHHSSSSEFTLDEQLEAKVDAVLTRMQQVGKENLTPEEQAILLRASEIYRKKKK
ncbi:MAG: rhomboid family intramembrane serine protease [Fimbriiglobus sp.]